MRRLLIAILVLVSFAVATAEAITVRDIIELSRAGLSEDVLLALIEVDGGVFPVDTVTLTKLKAAGVSERVIIAMVKSGRTRPASDVESVPPTPMELPPPEVIVERPPTEVVREVAVPFVVPVYVPFPVPSRGTRHDVDHRSVEPNQYVPRYLTDTPPQNNQYVPRYLTDTPQQPRSREPEYWGFGGKLRPDAWKPPRSDR